VAVRTQDLALRYLGPNPIDRNTTVNHVADIPTLRRRVDVVELQNHRIRLAAPRTRMPLEELSDEDATRLALDRIVASVARGVRAFVLDVVAPRIVAAAFSALRVTRASSDILESELVTLTDAAAARAQAVQLVPDHCKL
jgi:hypothetical protein